MLLDIISLWAPILFAVHAVVEVTKMDERQSKP
jgi:hypothetical protein